MVLKEKINLENNRNKDNFYKAFLFRDSEKSNWYKAYEWSAYLCEFFPNGLGDNNKLNPLHKKYNDFAESIINIGVPLTSFDKYFPGIKIEDVTSDIITFNVPLENKIDFNEYKEILNKWKNNFSIKEKNNKEKTNSKSNTKLDNLYNHPFTFLTLMKEIIKFDTYNKTEEELRNFILMLKNKCSDFIC